MMGFRKFGPLSYSVATDMDRTVALMHTIQLSVWRFRFEASFQTQASVDNIKRWRAYGALFDQAALKWGDRDHVRWALDDDDGGDYESALALMRRIIDGDEKNPWAEPEASA